MQCPLCREKVTDEDQLQVHYLMSCSGYVEDISVNKTKGSGSRSATTSVQFRWLKTKPTLAREVFLISSLAGSTLLKWNEVEECFLSETTDVPKGQHACQLIVDEDAITTEDFEVTDQTGIVDVRVAEASLADGSTGNISSNESHELQSHQTLVNPSNPSTSRNTDQTPAEKGALYKELIQHQLLHGDSLNGLAGNLRTDEGERFRSGRTRTNNLPGTAGGSNDFQQFLQPSEISDDHQQTPPVVNERDDADISNGDHPENGEITTEERDSSASVRDRAESSSSLSSHDELESRPVLMSSNGQNNDPELQVDGNGARDRTPILGSEHHVPDAQDYEVVPDHHDDHEEDPNTHEHVTDIHENEEIPDVENHEETSHIPGHEVTPEPDPHEDTPSVDDHVPILDEHASVPTTNQPTSLQDTHIEHRDNPPSVPELRDFESVQNNDRPLEQRERPTGDVTSGFQSTRVSSGPAVSSREPVGGNEETRRYNSRRVQVEDFLVGHGDDPVPSAPPASEFLRNSAGQTATAQTRVSDGYGGFDRGGPYSLQDQPQTNRLARRSPPGSLFGDQDIRRPPLYTSAPSHPYSSLPYTRDYSVISPLVSPRGDERSVPSVTRSGPNGEAFRDYGRIPRSTSSPSTAFQGSLDRQTPMGSVHTAGLSPPVSSSSQPTSPELWSEDRVKELLDSLKQPQKRKNGHSPDSLVSLRDRSESSETAVLKMQLAERDEYVKKLKARNAIYEKELVKLRAKEMELAKALSLAETSRAAAKEQEDIVSQLTHALSTKEMECSELERKVNDMKRTQNLLQTEMESSKKVHEIRVKELRSSNQSLAEEVKTLRQDSLQYSPDYVDKYKKLLDALQESRGVNASLQDQVKLQKKENLDLREKLGKMSTEIQLLKVRDVSSFARSDYTGTNEGAFERRHGYNSRPTAINGYLGTSESTKFIGRHQSDGEAKIRQKSRAIRGNYDITWDSRNGEARETGYTSRIPGDDQQVSAGRRDGSTSSSSFNRFALESDSPTRDAILSGRRRKAFADDSVSSDVPDIDVSRYLHTRSYSSDSITSPTLLQNRLSDGFRTSGKVTGRERSSQDVGLDYRKKEKKRRERPHSYHSGSYENLPSSVSSLSRTQSTPTPQVTSFAVRGHHMDLSPTSPESSDIAPLSYDRSSPKKGKPFAPNSPQEIDQGMDVLVTRACGKIGRGKVKFIGYLPTRSDTVYLGLELDKDDGKHDGQFQGQRYFKCKANRGIFVPFSKVVMAYT